MNIRCSSLPLALLCPGSQHPAEGEPLVTADHEAARLGSAAHEAMATDVHQDNDTALERIAFAYDVPADALKPIVRQAYNLWRNIGPSFAGAINEEAFFFDIGGGVTLSGHVDKIAHRESPVHILDWKFGRKDRAYKAQMLGYCALALLSRGEIQGDSATCVTVWVRDGEIETIGMDLTTLEPFLDRVRALAQWDGGYRTGDHCLYCPRRANCQARAAMERSMLDAFENDQPIAIAYSLDVPEQVDRLIAILKRADYVAALGRAARTHVKAMVEHCGGKAVGTETSLVINETHSRRLKVLRALAVIEDMGVTTEALATILDISLSGLEELVKHSAPKRGGAAAIRELRARLEQAEAIETTTFRTLSVKRTEDQ